MLFATNTEFGKQKLIKKKNLGNQVFYFVQKLFGNTKKFNYNSGHRGFVMKKFKLVLSLFVLCLVPLFFVACGNYEENNSKDMTTAAQRINPTVNVSLKDTRTYYEQELITRNELKLDENSTLGILTVKNDAVVLVCGLNKIDWVFTPTDQQTYRILYGSITIDAKQIVPTQLSVQTMPQKVSGYVAFDQFIDTGMALKITYNNGSVKYVTNSSNWTISYIDGRDCLNASDDKVFVGIEGLTAEIPFSQPVQKFRVQVPTILEKTYNGQTQRAEFAGQVERTFYELVDFSAKNVGEYDVIVNLNDFANCAWDSEETDRGVTLKFNINKAYRNVDVRATYSLWTGENLAVPENYVVVGDFEQNFVFDSTKLMLTYFVEDKQNLTTTANSGSVQDGGAPKFVGNYFVKATYLGDDNYFDSSSDFVSFKIVENDTELFDQSINYGWRYVTAGKDTKDLPYIKFETRTVDGLKVFCLNLIENEQYPLPFASGSIYYIDSTSFEIYAKDGAKIPMQLAEDKITLLAQNQLESTDSFVFEKWSVPAYVGRYECDRSGFVGGGTDVLIISAVDGKVTFEADYSYRTGELATEISGTSRREGYVLQDKEGILHFMAIENDAYNEIDTFELENVNVAPTSIVLRLDINYREPLTFIKVS